MRNPEAMITTMYRWILIKSCENYSTSTHFQFPNMKLVGSLVLRIGNRYVEKDALKSTNHGTISEWGIEHYVAKVNHNLGTEIFDCYGMKFHKLRPALICIAHPGLDSWRWKTPITRHRNPPDSGKKTTDERAVATSLLLISKPSNVAFLNRFTSFPTWHDHSDKENWCERYEITQSR